MDKTGLHKLLNLEVNPESQCIIVYSEIVSSRLNYVAKFIFENVLKVKVIITNDSSEFKNSEFFKINYSKKIISNSFQIYPHQLLFETGISPTKPNPCLKKNLIYFYENEIIDSNSNLDFDIFSSVFYFISRMEEWQAFEADVHGRFEAKASILYKSKMHLKPVVDYWIQDFKTELQKFYPSLKFPANKFKIISTIDIDNLFAFKHKGFLRTTGAIIKDILKVDFKNLKLRFKVLSKKESDPFDIYSSVSDFCQNLNIPLIYFFLFKTGNKYDRTVNPMSNSFLEVFGRIKNKGGLIGLHPSYYSSTNKEILKKEITDFSRGINDKVNFSRQHYLKFDIKATPKLLIENGIIADFTMGFASAVGFRAGTSFPFYYYDFVNENQTDLLLVPFCAMDGAYFVYDKSDSEMMMNSLLDLAKEVKQVNGFFITVFHERTFSSHLYPKYNQVYKNLFQKLNG